MCLAIPGRVIEVVDEANRLALVDVGDWVLIHVGFALSKVDEEEAHATLALLQAMGQAYEDELRELQASGIE